MPFPLYSAHFDLIVGDSLHFLLKSHFLSIFVGFPRKQTLKASGNKLWTFSFPATLSDVIYSLYVSSLPPSFLIAVLSMPTISPRVDEERFLSAGLNSPPKAYEKA